MHILPRTSRPRQKARQRFRGCLGRFSMVRRGKLSALVWAALIISVIPSIGCKEYRVCDDTGCFICDGIGCRPEGISETITPPCGNGQCNCSDTMPCADPRFDCIDGRCRAQRDTCRFESDCAGTRLCIDGRCLAPCADMTLACPDSLSCLQLTTNDGVLAYCDENPNNQIVCDDNTPCINADELCVQGQCRQGCEQSEQCDDTDYCASDGVCRIEDRPVGGCLFDEECDFICVDGLCRSPCNDQGDYPSCRAYDPGLSSCLFIDATETLGLCVSSEDALSDCRLPSDCAQSGVRCINGVCQ